MGGVVELFFLALAMSQTFASDCDSLPGTQKFIVELFDEFGDGWNGNKMRIVHCDENATAWDPAHDPETLTDGVYKKTHVCLPPDIDDEPNEYTIIVDGGTWGDEVSWNISYPDEDPRAGTLWHGGGDPYYFSTCPTPAPTVCDGHPFTIQMSDSYSDGWQSNELVILDCDGHLLKGPFTLLEGAFDEVKVCLPESTFLVECGGGAWAQEVSWVIVDDATDVEVAAGGAGEYGAPEQVSLCKSCFEMGGENVTVLVNKALLPDGGEWWDPDADAFVDVNLGDSGGDMHTKTKHNNNHPKWRTYLDFGCVLPSETMTVKVIDEDTIGSNDLLVYNQWIGWREWPEGQLKRLNDTQSSNKDAYHKEYYVEVAYFVGALPELDPTPMPTPRPTPNPPPSTSPTKQPSIAPPTPTPPTPNPPTPTPPTPTPPTPNHKTPSPSHAPTHPDDGGEDSSAGTSNEDKASSDVHGANAGAIVGIVLGVLGALALCGVGTHFFAKNKGYGGIQEMMADYGIGPGAYTKMGGTSGSIQGMGMGAGSTSHQSGMTFNGLRDNESDDNGSGNSGGYVPPAIAMPGNDNDEEEDEEEVSLGQKSAIV